VHHVDHLLDHLPGQVLKVLRHGDFEGLRVDGPELARGVLKIGAAVGGQRLELVDRQLVGEHPVPALRHDLGASQQLVLQRLGDVGGIEDAAGRLVGHLHDVVQALPRVRNLASGPLQHLVVAEFAQAVVQLAGEVTEAIEDDLLLALRAARSRRRRGTAGTMCLFGHAVEQRLQVVAVARGIALRRSRRRRRRAAGGKGIEQGLQILGIAGFVESERFYHGVRLASAGPPQGRRRPPVGGSERM